MKVYKKTNLRDNLMKTIFLEREHLERCTGLRIKRGNNLL
jgi:hypothetical protein